MRSSAAASAPDAQIHYSSNIFLPPGPDLILQRVTVIDPPQPPTLPGTEAGGAAGIREPLFCDLWKKRSSVLGDKTSLSLQQRLGGSLLMDAASRRAWSLYSEAAGPRAPAAAGSRVSVCLQQLLVRMWRFGDKRRLKHSKHPYYTPLAEIFLYFTLKVGHDC